MQSRIHIHACKRHGCMTTHDFFFRSVDDFAGFSHIHELDMTRYAHIIIENVTQN